ncbi:MAG: OB-fold putative lipoprotein [Bacteroidales bacterium]|jgi:hypothetical protein|nr:OB-fold putative lipoprotein [Bacteroidales bacterium]
MKTYVKVALGVVLLLAIAGIMAAIYLFLKEPADTARAKPEFTVTASGLLKDFAADEAAATAKYAGRIIEINGIISEVRSDNNATTVALSTGDPMSSVLCTLAPGADASALKEGRELIIRGECSGFLMDVLLKNCSIIQIK